MRPGSPAGAPPTIPLIGHRVGRPADGLASLVVMADEGTKLDLDWARTLAAALGAVSSTLLLSTLGAAGTILGAALGSVVVTVTTALYNQGLAKSKAQLDAAREQALVRVGLAKAEVHRAAVQPQSPDDLARARAELSRAEADLDGPPEEPPALGWRERLALLPWKRIAAWTAAVFVAVVAVITVVELLLGRPVSSVVGGSDSRDGTSITRVVDRSEGRGGDQRREPREDPTSPDDPSTGPSPSAPTDTATTTPSPTEEPTTVPSEPLPTTPAPSTPATPTPTPTAPAPPG